MVFGVGSTCERFAGTDGYYAADSGACYVVFPRRNSRAKSLWFDARNKCLKEGGDLADGDAVNLSLPPNQDSSENLKYLVGLRRDVFMWIETGERHFHMLCRFRVAR